MILIQRVVLHAVRSALPEELAEAFVGDLEEGLRKRSESEALLWLLREVVSIPYIRLWRQARRLRGQKDERVGLRGGGEVMMILHDVRSAVRSLRVRPGFAATVIGVLTLSVGAATLIFSVLEGVLLRPLPYPEPDRLVKVYGTNLEWRDGEQEMLRASWDRLGLSLNVLDDWHRRGWPLEAVGATMRRVARFEDGGAPAELLGAHHTAGLFETFRVEPILGRLPTPEELEEGAPVVLLSQALWSRRYGRDPEVLGRSVSLDGVARSVIGVLPQGFAIPLEGTEWWSPPPILMVSERRDTPLFQGFARLVAGVSRDEASAALGAAMSQLGESHPVYAALGARTVSLRDDVVGTVKGGVTLLFGAVASSLPGPPWVPAVPDW